MRGAGLGAAVELQLIYTTAVDAARAVPEVTLTRETLNGTVARAVTLLKAIGTSETLRAALVERGYDNEEFERLGAQDHQPYGVTVRHNPPRRCADRAPS